MGRLTPLSRSLPEAVAVGQARRFSAISYFNVFLKEELEFIGADTNFTFHAFRNARIAEAGTDHAANRHDIMHGAGHSTGGSHSVSYNSLDASWIMGGAGYRGTDPEVLCPQQNLLHCYLDRF